MQRRLTIALVATALVSIILVGFGVLAMAQLSARSDAEQQVDRGLNVLAAFLGDSSRPRRQVEALLLSSRANFGLDLLEPVVVGPDGTIDGLSERRRLSPGAASDFPALTLTEGQTTRLAAGETVLVTTGNRVVGLRTVSFQPNRNQGGTDITVLAARRITAVSRRTVAWFVLSSLAVIGGAVVAGLLLAGRLVKPIRQIKAATAAIAAGNLDARVEPTGSDELADLGHEVNRMAADLQRSKALDRQFLMSVSHDLKTPLTAISGYAEGLSDGAISNARAAGQVIGNHARRLDRLVGDLLDLARLDSNRFRLNIRPFDLSVLTGRTVAGLTNHAAGHGLTLVRDGLETITVSADSDRTAQAIGNLVDNAIKFAASTVTVGVGTYGDGWAVVSVRDDGPGIAEGDLPYIFDRLYTGRAQPERAENPTGLGLAIVRELANAMGGTVTAANNPGGGACISLLLPIGGPGSEPGRHESAPPPPLTNS